MHTDTLDPALRQGAELFNRGEWWEAHEAWEPVWMEAGGERRHFVQGLILLAAALHKRWHHGSTGLRNYHKALAHLEPLPDLYGGVRLRQLEQQVLQALSQDGMYPQLPVGAPHP
ncbi:DUF309 domain-containing protein [Deinococcus sonorensis]|uniref:DUF309 domain-containing protein n=2 Tax=Deinococcus sonorensis TaxID=309891 RepID=A0AAU7UEA5_9DEIO